MQNSILVAVRRRTAFQYVASWTNARDYIPGVFRVERVGEVHHGVGTRLRASVALAGLVPKGLPIETVTEVVEFVEDERIVCRSLKGLRTTNAWLFRERDAATEVTAIVTCVFPGRLAGRLAAGLMSRWLSDAVAGSLVRLKRGVEGRS